MNTASYRFNLEIQSEISQVSIPVRRLENSRRLYITLSNGGEPFTIADGCQAILFANIPNKDTFANSCIIEKNSTIRYDFSQQLTAHAGVVACEMRIYSPDGGLLESPKFTIVVSDRVVNDNDIPVSEDEKSLIDNIITNEANRVAAEQSREDTFNILKTSLERAIVGANEAAEKANNVSDGKDGVSPTVKVDPISGGHKVTITDKDGPKSFTVMNGATVNDVIAALPKYNGEVVDV